ncbi:MAG TPA: hypothetical protein DCL38_01475 [Lachnospiraceae bacterium]|nr:hypothetical protein [Lachnospiraceae bacterium]
MIKYKVSGTQRKELVKRLESLTGEKARYLGMPSIAFKVGSYTVRKDGTVEGELPEDIIKGLARSGFKAEYIMKEPEEPKKPEGLIFIIKEPSGKACENFSHMIESKGSLIKAAFGLKALPIDCQDDMLVIRWFEDVKLPPEELETVTAFVTGMISRSEKAVFVKRDPVDMENPRYNLRAFMYSLGFTGEKYKRMRRAMLMKVEGQASRKHKQTEATRPV